MWILSCDGELWSNRRRWLRPGSRHLLGRTHNREPGHRVESIDDKSVSRKHVIIAVGNAVPSDSGNLHVRTGITVTDDSKIGTQINGEKVHKATRALSDAREYTIKLGSYKHVFRLMWQPVTLTLSHFGSKRKDEGMAQARQLFAGSDVKLVLEYVQEHTTHLVANKRNIVAALQALTQARWLVAPEFLDGLAGAVASTGLDENGEPIPSPLEINFDANFPNAMDMPAPSGSRELVKRSGQSLQPRPERAEVFQDYLFVFLSQAQYDTLMPAVTSGGGKAMLWEVVPHESNVQDLVAYIRELAGKKGNHQFKLSQQSKKGGVVVVRLGDKNDDWVVRFLIDTELTLDQRSIEQGEFLDAIITVDASGLRRPLEEAVSVAGSVPPPSQSPKSQSRSTQMSRSDVQTQNAPSSPQGPEPEEQTPISPQVRPAHPESGPVHVRRGKRIMTQSRLKRFDDDDDDADEAASPNESTRLSALTQSADEQNRHDHVENLRSRHTDVGGSSRPEQSQTNVRKRPALAEPEREEDMLDSMLEGQAAMKRLKLSAAATRDENSPSTSDISKAETRGSGLASQTKRKPKQRDLMAELQMKREKEEEDRRKDEESLRMIADGVDVSKLKDVAKVEGMDLPVRERPTYCGVEDGHSERWDPAWDGRKNFKRFRRQGQDQERAGRRRVIVTLEEVPRKGHGIGEQYWQSIPSHASSGKSKSRIQSQTQVVHESQADSSNNDVNTEMRFRRRLQRSREEDAADSQIFPEEIAGTARDQDLQPKSYAIQFEDAVADSQRPGTSKRPASVQVGPQPKKLKQSTIAPASRATDRAIVDDDDDALKFRRKRR